MLETRIYACSSVSAGSGVLMFDLHLHTSTELTFPLSRRNLDCFAMIKFTYTASRRCVTYLRV